MSTSNAPAKRPHRPRKAMRPGLIMALAGMLLVAAPTLAHKLNVFAAADGRLIQGQAYFSGGAPAVGLDVLVQDASGTRLARAQTDAEGAFQVEAAAPVTHHILVRTGDGHQAEWRIGADELAAAFSAGSEPAEAAPARVDVAAAAPAAGFHSNAQPDSDSDSDSDADPDSDPNRELEPALVAAIERVVARQVRPLREETLAAREAVRLRDVLGGLGYILGLTGLGLWWHCRRDRDIDRSRASPGKGVV